MQKNTLILIYFLCLNTTLACQLVCNQKEVPSITLPHIKSTTTNWQKLGIALQPKKNEQGAPLPYQTLKKQIHQNRNQYLVTYQRAQNKKTYLDTIRYELTEQLLNGIIPYWYGTPWDFNGHTNVPNEGKIACGYFVSTTLKHLGFQLNRYKMAQQSALSEIKTLQTQPIIWLDQAKGDDLKSYLDNHLAEGLYVIGLDFHVGYLLKRQGKGFFIHANYGHPQMVVIEPIEMSAALAASNTYAIGHFTHNDALLKKWLFKQNIPIVMD